METSIYSNSVCELLAQQLATEQADVVKHQAIVESIQKTIFSKKKEIIKRIVDTYFFYFEGKRYSALDLSFGESDGKLIVSINFGIDPTEIDLEGLTRRETELLKQYRKDFERSIDYEDKEACSHAISVARSVYWLKNRINLLRFETNSIHIDQAISPGFFEETGINIRTRGGLRDLESYTNNYGY